jgi:hypothetical protein
LPPYLVPNCEHTARVSEFAVDRDPRARPGERF